MAQQPVRQVVREQRPVEQVAHPLTVAEPGERWELCVFLQDVVPLQEISGA